MSIKSLLKPEIKRGLVEVAQWELYSINLYLYMANQSQRLGLVGSYKYFKAEAHDEVDHYDNLASYVNDRGDFLDVPMVEKVEENISGLMDILNVLYETMIEIENAYKKLYKKAEDMDDCVTSIFVQKYLKLQRKAIGLYGDLIARLSLNKVDLLEMDKYIGEL